MPYEYTCHDNNPKVAAAIKRGEEIRNDWTAERVILVSRRGLEVSFNVLGDSNEWHRVTLATIRGTIRVQCLCRSMYLCKHAGAVLPTYRAMTGYKRTATIDGHAEIALRGRDAMIALYGDEMSNAELDTIEAVIA